MRTLIAFALAVALSGCATMSGSAIQARFDEAMAETRAEWVAENREYVSDDVAEAIIDGRVIVGMTLEEARVAWSHFGPPVTVNRSLTADGESVQYVFERGRRTSWHQVRYLYVDNGVVTAAQY